MRVSAVRSRLALVTVATMMAALAVVVTPAEGAARGEPKAPKVQFWLTIAHNNDGESRLINAGSGLEDYGGSLDSPPWCATSNGKRSTGETAGSSC